MKTRIMAKRILALWLTLIMVISMSVATFATGEVLPNPTLIEGELEQNEEIIGGETDPEDLMLDDQTKDDDGADDQTKDDDGADDEPPNLLPVVAAEPIIPLETEQWEVVASETYDFEVEAPVKVDNNASANIPGYGSDRVPLTKEDQALNDVPLRRASFFSGRNPFGAIKSEDSIAAYATETLELKSVAIVTGGAVQIQFNDKITEDSGKYYTDQTNASMTEPRVFTVSTTFVNEDAAGDVMISGDTADDYAGFLAQLDWTYGEVELSKWRKASTVAVNAPLDGEQFIAVIGQTLSTNGSKYKLETEIRFDTPLYSLAQRNDAYNIPYDGYANTRQGASSDGSFVTFRPEYVDDLIDTYALAVNYESDDESKKIELGSRDVKLNLYDSYMKWSEMDQYAKDLQAESNGNGGTINGRYVGVSSLGKTLRNNDIWNVVISDSQNSVDEYLNVTKPMMQTNPQALKEQIVGGNQKTALYFNNIHADETPGTETNIQLINLLVRDEDVTYTTVDEYKNVSYVPEGNGFIAGYAEQITAGSTTDISYKVNDVLEKFIVVVTITANPDGRELLLRGNTLGFDMNRQGAAQTQIENIALAGDLVKWNPLTMSEYHGYVRGMLIEPCTGPHAPYYEYDLLYPKLIDQAHDMGKAILGNTPLNRFLVPAEHYRDGWDDGAAVYSPMFAMLYGTLGYTIEIPYANEDAVNACTVASKALIYNSLQNRDDLYLNKLEYMRRGVANEDLKTLVDEWFVDPYNNDEVVGRPRTTDENGVERSYFPEYYILPVDGNNQFNVPETFRAMAQLERNGVVFRKTNVPVVFDGLTYPAGTYVVDMHQYAKNYIHAVLSEGYDASNFSSMYAEITLNLPDLRGFKVATAWNKGLFDGKTTAVDHIEKPVIDTSRATELITIKSGSTDVVRLVNRLLKAGKPVHMITSYTPDGNIGDFIAKSADVNDHGFNADESVYAITQNFEAGNSGLEAVSKPVVMPKIAAIGSPIAPAYPQGTNVTPLQFMLPFLEFSSYTVTPTMSGALSGYNVVFNDNVDLSNSTSEVIEKKIPYVGIRANGVSSVASLENFTLGDRTTALTYGEGVFRMDISSTNPVTSAFADAGAAYFGSYGRDNVMFGMVPSGTKTLMAITSGGDNFKGGWWNNDNNSYDHTAMDGKVTAISGFAGVDQDVSITLFGTNTMWRGNTQAYWPMMAQAMYMGASDILDMPRPYVVSDLASHSGTNQPYKVTLTAEASDATDSTATVTNLFFKLNNTEKEAAYNQSDIKWLPLDTTVNINQEGQNYLHWYVENSDGQTSQGTFGPYVFNQAGSGSGGNAADKSKSTTAIGGSTDPKATNTITMTAKNIDTTKSNTVVDGKALLNDAKLLIAADLLESVAGDTKAHDLPYTIDFETQHGVYKVPANLSTISTELGKLLADKKLELKDVNYVVAIKAVPMDDALVQSIQNNLSSGKIFGSVVMFEITVVQKGTGDVIGILSSFDEPIERILPLPEGTTLPSQWGAFKLSGTNELEFVWHKTITVDGGKAVAVRSDTNSVYVVASNPVAFEDVNAGFWGKRFIDTAAAKKLVVGTGEGVFEPNRGLTRAEFAQMLVGALKTPKATTQTVGYSDVISSSWFYNSVMSAKAAQLLVGFGGSEFNPNQPITREEMASMLGKAIQLETTKGNSQADLGAVFSDYDQINSNYVADVALVTNMKIMQGMGNGQFDPKGEVTRAQATTVQIVLLQKLGLID